MRDDDSDADFERRYPQKRPGLPLWAILLIVFGAVGFFGCLGVVGLGMFGMLFGATAAVAPGPPPVAMTMEDEPRRVPEVFTRAEFEREVLGKTTAEVKELLGESPFRFGGESKETWVYRERTTNPATGQPDETAEVVFRGGKVVRVGYRDEAGPGGPGPAPGK